MFQFLEKVVCQLFTYLYGCLELVGFIQRPPRHVVVVRHVYSASLHEQVEPVALLAEDLDGRLCHLRQGRLLVTAVLQVVQHVRVLEQPCKNPHLYPSFR